MLHAEHRGIGKAVSTSIAVDGDHPRAFRDMREFLAALEDEGELARVRRPVRVEYEVGAVCSKLMRRFGPAVLFEETGRGIPLVTRMLATRDRYALALGTSPDQLTRVLRQRTGQPLPPRLVSDGPCQEHVLLGDEVDLTRLPIPILNAKDGGPYITLGVQFSRDPVEGWTNAAIYRLQVKGPRLLGIQSAESSHLNAHARKTPGGELPVAIAIGLDPAIEIAAAIPSIYPPSEIEVAGGLRGAPVELVKCKTVDLEVPATAEIVLEGTLRIHDLRPEGPFGEFTGYYGTQADRPSLEIHAITHRDRPIYRSADIGIPSSDTNALQTFPLEAQIMKECPLPGIKAVNIPVGSACFNCIVSVEKPWDGFGKMIGGAILGTWPARYIKTLIVVDADVDPFDYEQVFWALATRFRPKDDLVVFPDAAGDILDPSLRGRETITGVTSKLIVDATRPIKEPFAEVLAPDPAVLARVEAEWASYRIRGT